MSEDKGLQQARFASDDIRRGAKKRSVTIVLFEKRYGKRYAQNHYDRVKTDIHRRTKAANIA